MKGIETYLKFWNFYFFGAVVKNVSGVNSARLRRRFSDKWILFSGELRLGRTICRFHFFRHVDCRSSLGFVIRAPEDAVRRGQPRLTWISSGSGRRFASGYHRDVDEEVGLNLLVVARSLEARTRRGTRQKVGGVFKKKGREEGERIVSFGLAIAGERNRIRGPRCAMPLVPQNFYITSTLLILSKSSSSSLP